MWLAGLEVALGLGFVIFVHELGHFTVAKLCGVRVDKFMIGFDIGGIRLASFRWGETLYGIGILPLGGYVKMLGQEDNPAQLRKEMERARQEAAEKASRKRELPGDSAPEADRVPACGCGSPESESPAETRLYDPRSYLAKSVPKRMAIISAGVIMNMIFAFVFAVCAYLVGVKDHASIVGGVVAGGGAWQAGVQADDRIEEVAGRKVSTFQGMMHEIVNGDMNGIPLVIRRPGADEPLKITVKPQESGGRPTIGVLSSRELQIVKEKETPVFLPGTAAEEAKPQFLRGDRIVKVDGQPLERYGQLLDYLAAHPDKPLQVTVVRSKGPGRKDEKPAATEEVTIDVPASPMKQFGLTMQMGPIVAVQADSPAANAKIRPGDLLQTIDGQPVGDPLRVPDEIRKRAGTEVTLGLQRDDKPMTFKVKLSSVSRYCQPDVPDSPVALPELGVAYFVLNKVASVAPGGPAAEAGLQPGDQLTGVKISPPSEDQLKAMREKYHDDDMNPKETTIPFKDDERNWPCFMLALQSFLPETKFEFTWQRDKKEMSGKPTPVPAKDWFDAERGWVAEPTMITQKAGNLGDALQMGSHETVDSALLVYRSLHSVGTNKVSVRMVAGPWGILQAALFIARSGFGNFLAFLTLLSANLAVLNFLPIPLLDGGHMVLLIYEGVRGKPAGERVQEVMTWIGLILILTLMVWAFGLDLGFFARPGAH